MLWVPSNFYGLPLDSPEFSCLSWAGETRTGDNAQEGNTVLKEQSHQCHIWGDNPFPSLADYRMPSAFLATWSATCSAATLATCWLMFSWLSISVPRSFVARKLSSCSSQAYIAMWCSWDPSTGPNTYLWWMPCDWTWLINLAYRGASAKPSYSLAVWQRREACNIWEWQFSLVSKNPKKNPPPPLFLIRQNILYRNGR